MKVLVIGGVAAGASAATRLRRMDESAEIIMLEQGSYVSFANCGLPYYVGGDIPDRDDLLLVSPELFRTRFRIDVRLHSLVSAINREKKTVTVHAEGKVFEDPESGSFIVCGARFQHHVALHIAMMSGDHARCIEFAKNYAAAQNIPKLYCTFTLDNPRLESALVRENFTPDPSDLITKEIVF